MAHEQEPIPDTGIEVDRLSARIRMTQDYAVLPWKRIGQELRDARERKGKQLDDVWRAIKIRPDHLTAIEEGRFEDLPSRALVLGYVSRYARYVGLDVEKLPRRLEAEIGPDDGPGIDVEPVPDRKFPPLRNVLAGLMLATFIIVAYGISLYAALYFVGLILS
jgi:cytoskeleton protein RodZ